ncbi:MAG: relaxase domain-containing protein [Gammaproteobacteria bacterium]|nr:relaxase domain-containing protein [Gammaproteobacteria bacterium]MBU0849340.1 relaxase domain-containing protein [Gammaproteobacteria bacterium]MBU1268835.1 relaxase domain-containing protein [Gammaproteobacteria bacterium]MBU1527695.1 relaxase domain-containing protein [Gammaproteobacteria bacterium]MBU1779640.1 relaxase domain-containing protein [Gammaproteobacteria bacterium]
MVATWSPAANSSYYTNQTEYYIEDGASNGRWFCPSGQLGITDHSAVIKSNFEQLFQGLDETGEPYLSNSRTDRTPAFDVTLSAPRSVSLLWAFGRTETRNAIEKAQERAARATLQLLEKEAAFARRGRGGMHLEKVALSAACFVHTESRPAQHADGRVFEDPNLHTHCVILNLATRADKSNGAIHSVILRNWKMAAGATYHQALAYELQSMGFAIDRVGKNGIFEIAGIDEKAIRYFSARRQEIENELQEAGTTSGESVALAASLAKSTRGAKIDTNEVELTTIWREVAHDNHLNIDQLEQNARQASALTKTKSQDLLANTQLSALPRQLTEIKSIIDRRELLRAGAASLVGTELSPEKLSEALDQLIAFGSVKELSTDALGQSVYSTPEMIRIEQEIVSMASELVQSPWLSVGEDSIKRQCQQRNLNDQQIKAALKATSTSRIAVIEGAPGSGKTTTLSPIVDVYRKEGCRVIGGASAWKIANMLRDDLQIESRAIASWIEQSQKGQLPLDSSTLFIVDEAGLLSSREMHSILNTVRESGAKLLLVGDPDQLQAIGAGPGLSLVTRSVEQAKVSKIVRQNEQWLRVAITSLGEGKAKEALTAFHEHGLLIESEGPRASIVTVVDQWEEIRKENPTASQIIIAKTNAEVHSISQEVRSRLQNTGIVTGPSISFQATTSSGHPTEITLAAGDQIRFLVKNDSAGVINGSIGRVVKVSETQTGTSKYQRIIADIGERRIVFSPDEFNDEKGRARLGWAYASTIYGAQGLTVDHATVLLNNLFDRHDIYVAASRARCTTKLITDKCSIDREIRLMQQPDTPTAYSSDSITSSERHLFLAATLSRSIPKQSTLDVADFHNGVAEQLIQNRNRALQSNMSLEVDSPW